MRRMDEMTQHNAALVEETNAAIEQTEAQAVELDRIVDVFTLDEPVAQDLPRPSRPCADGAAAASRACSGASAKRRQELSRRCRAKGLRRILRRRLLAHHPRVGP